VTTKEVSLRGHNTPHNLRGNNIALSDHQLQGAEAPSASGEDLGINLERSTAYSVVSASGQGPYYKNVPNHPLEAKGDSRSRSSAEPAEIRSCTLLRATLPTYQSMWAIIPQLLWLRLVTHRLPGHNSHPRHHYSQPILDASQKGASTLSSNVKSERNPKLAQSIVLCQNQSTSIERYPTPEVFFVFYVILFFNKEQTMQN
jgi:hypothetical protein